MSVEWLGQEVEIISGRGRTRLARDYVMVLGCEDKRRHIVNVDELKATGGDSEIETRIVIAERKRRAGNEDNE